MSLMDRTLPPPQQAAYIIYRKGNIVVAEPSPETRFPKFSGEDASTVIQQALNSLTPNRTWKEKVVLKGDLGEVYDVQIPSFTIIEGAEAKLTLPPDKSFIFKDKIAGVNSVDILKIIFKASTPRTVWCTGIDLSTLGTASQIKIEDCSFIDFIFPSGTPSGIRGKYDGLSIIGNDFISESGSGNSYQVYLSMPSEVRIINNYFRSRFPGNNIYTHQANCLKVLGNHFVQDANWDTAPIEAIDAHGKYISIVGNTFKDLSIDGVLVNERNNYNVEYISIVGNIFKRCGYLHLARRAGISLCAPEASYYVDKVEIVGNVFDGCAVGVRVGETGRNDIVKFEMSNNWIENSDYPVVFYGSGFNIRMLSNIFRNNTYPPHVEGGTLYARRNVGYVTENSGAATITAGNTYVDVAHGLAITPDINRIKVTPKDNLGGRSFWISNVGAATFRINISSVDTVDHVFGWCYE